jgi:hypothetical protein
MRKLRKRRRKLRKRRRKLRKRRRKVRKRRRMLRKRRKNKTRRKWRKRRRWKRRRTRKQKKRRRRKQRRRRIKLQKPVGISIFFFFHLFAWILAGEPTYIQLFKSYKWREIQRHHKKLGSGQEWRRRLRGEWRNWEVPCG